jgi:hypothetical protein
MKNIIALSILAVSLGVASAQTTNNPESKYDSYKRASAEQTPKLTLEQKPDLKLDGTNSSAKDESGQWGKELTIGGSGISDTHGHTQIGLDVSFSIQPLKLPIWVGISQSVAWEPSFAGSTDLDASYGINVWNGKLYVEPGWAGGWVYDKYSYYTRTGPELIVEYYLKDNVFLYGQLNYDLFVTGAGEKGLREAFGIGFAW